MVFSSVTFVFFFLPAVLLAWMICPKQARVYAILTFSLVFFAFGDITALLLMLASVVVSWLSGLWMEKRMAHHRVILIGTLVLHLVPLFVYKYASFMLGTQPLALPLGISFFTFQGIAYCVDVYRGRVKAERNIVRYAAFISFFPQLIAGPIERYEDIAPQLRALPSLSMQNVADGARLFIIGLSKKLLLADPMGQCWETLSQDPAQAGFVGCWVAALAFAFQIYFDFSGYSSMARGLARMLGITLRENFKYPYIARGASDFWRRWHITLSDWFREYVYIPLGGNRKGKPRQILNLLAVWLLTGLWHGAGWNFILWGVYWGALVILEKLVKRPIPRGITQICILLGWVLFACEDMARLPLFLSSMLLPSTLCGSAALPYVLWYLPMLALCAFCSVPHQPRKRPRAVVLFALLVLCVAAMTAGGYSPFLYFRF